MRGIELLLLVVTVALGAFLYFFKLGEIPNGLYVDEAVTGYNAYSLLTTGKDEYGKTLPVVLRFFVSYSPPLYTYLTIPVINLLGLTVTSTRFVAALSGIIAIVVMFFFLKALPLTNRWTPFLGAFLFTITPWAIFYSRVGYEMNIGFVLFALGVLFLWYSLKHPFFLVLGIPTLSLSMYGAHAQQILVPLFLLGVGIFLRKELFVKKNKKYLVWGVFLATILQLPYLSIITTPAFFTKGSLFYSDVITSQAEKIANYLPIFIAIPLAFLREFFSKFLTYFSPRSLFFLPDPDPQRSLPELSVFYSWMVIPYLVGLYVLWQQRKRIDVRFIVLLAAISALPPSLTRDPFSTQRALPLLLPITLSIALGIDWLITRIRTIVWIPAATLLIAFSLLLLWRSYFVLFPHERARTWGYGFQQFAEYIETHPHEHFIIDQSRIKPAYIELAFFMRYPPEQLQSAVNPTIKDNYYTNTQFNPNYTFANIETRTIHWEEDIYKEQILVGDELAISEQQAKEHFLNRVFEIRDPLDYIVFQGFKTNPTQKCAATQNQSVLCKKEATFQR